MDCDPVEVLFVVSDSLSSLYNYYTNDVQFGYAGTGSHHATSKRINSFCKNTSITKIVTDQKLVRAPNMKSSEIGLDWVKLPSDRKEFTNGTEG